MHSDKDILRDGKDPVIEKAICVSVIIPTYNHCNYILETIKSVRNQTLNELEIIVINDGSPDNTEAILQPLIDRGELRYFRQENKGQAAARNRGLAVAEGEFIALLDDDDTWPVDHLQWQVNALRSATDAVMVYGTVQRSTASAPELPEGDSPPVQGRAHFATRCPLVSPGQALFRASSLRSAGGLDPALKGTDDWDLYLRLSAIGTVLFENRLALYYRVHPNNASKNFSRMFVNGMAVVDKHFPAAAGNTQTRREAISFVRHVAAQIGIGEVIALRSQRRYMAMLVNLLKVIRIRPALLAPASLVRRARYLIGPRT